MDRFRSILDWSRAAGALLDWLYPPRCRSCAAPIVGADEDCFCAGCLARVRLVAHPLCPRCGRPFFDAAGDDHLCGDCIARPPRFQRARAWACYPGGDDSAHPLREVIQRFKYGRKISLGKSLGRLTARAAEELFVGQKKIDLIVPVPLHARRLRWRGFNQALVLAREVGRVRGLPVDPFILRRSRPTPPQTQLAEEERRKNVRGAFTLRSEEAVADRVVLLVDDIYTSGATANECSRVLLRGGAEEVRVLTLARTI